MSRVTWLLSGSGQFSTQVCLTPDNPTLSHCSYFSSNVLSHLFIPPSNKHMLAFLFQVLGCMFPYSQSSHICWLESCMQQLSFLQISEDSKDDLAKFVRQSKCPRFLQSLSFRMVSVAFLLLGPFF